MAKFTWQDGTLVSKAKVEIGGTIYEVDPEEYSGTTPLSASNLNAMQDGIYEDIDNKIGKYEVLYSNIEGSLNNIECSKSLENYDYLQIDYEHQKKYGSAIVPTLSPFEITTMGFAEGTTIAQLSFTSYNINGKNIEVNDAGIVNFQNASIQYQGTSRTIKIIKVRGIKY